MVPSLSRAREAARRTICGTRIGELLKATSVYLADWRRYPPSLANTPQPWVRWSKTDWLGAGHEGWEAHHAPQTGLYFPILGTADIYLCASDRAEIVQAGGMTTVRRFSYSMNGRLGLALPGRSGLASDSRLPTFFEEDPASNLDVRPEGCFTGTDRPFLRHAGRTNIGYADGHVDATEERRSAKEIYEELQLPAARTLLQP